MRIGNLSQLVDAYIADVKEGKSCMGHRKFGNLEFRDGILYSHGWFPIAAYIGGARYLVTGDKFSVSTSKHICYVTRAIPSICGVIVVPDLKAHLDGNKQRNLFEYSALIAQAYNHSVRARLPGSKNRWSEECNFWTRALKEYKVICAEGDSKIICDAGKLAAELYGDNVNKVT